MAEHTPPLESGQLLSTDLPLLTPPPPPPPPTMVNGDGAQQVGTPGSDCRQLRLMTHFVFGIFYHQTLMFHFFFPEDSQVAQISVMC